MQRILVNNVSIKIVFVFFLFQIPNLVGQSSSPQGTKTYGLEYGDQGNQLILNEDGSYIFLGTLNNSETNSEDMWLVELDSSGEIIWQQVYGGNSIDRGYRMLPDTSGGYLLVGATQSYGAGGFDAWLTKIDSSGNPQWQKTYGNSLDDYVFDAIPAEDGGYILSGTLTSEELGKNDVWVFKVDSQGDIVWETIMGDFDQDQARSVKQTSDGGYIVAGYTVQDLDTRYDLWLVKLDSEGDSLWSRIYGGDERDVAQYVQEISENKIMVMGYNESLTGDIDIWIIVTDSLGYEIKSTTFGGASTEYGHILNPTKDGNFIITGYTESYGAGGWDLLILKVDPDGNEIWSKTFGGSSKDFGHDIFQDQSGGYVCLGITDSYGAGGFDAWMIWTDSTGNIPPPTLQDDLMAHYSFDGNANDMSGNGNDGIVHGAVLTGDRFENPTGAYYFDGVDDYIRVPDDDVLTPTNNNLTISIWAKVDNSADKYFIYKGDSQINREYFLGVTRDTLASFAIHNQGGGGSNQHGLPSESILENNSWYHMVGTWDGTTQKIYINGKLENVASPPVAIRNYDSDLYIGTYGGDISGYALRGDIDDIKIYNRALSEEEILQLYGGTISADFTADNTYGIAPLMVNFSDQSTTLDSLLEINSWQWDFNNDGEIDSQEQNPQWTFTESGMFTVKLTVSDSINQASITKENFITVLSEEPIILSIADIPNDQGGWVIVDFFKSIFDTDTLTLPKSAASELYTVEINDGSGWMAAANTAAYGLPIYSVLVPTTKNSTVSDDGLIDFRVIAGMEEGNFVSNTVSGYSVDNLKPAVPQGVGAGLTEGSDIIVSWERNVENDVESYTVYRSVNESAFESLGKTTEISFTDDDIFANNTYSYTVTALDFSGNESNQSDVVSLTITTIDKEKSLPIHYYLSQNYPNPFNPETTIKYGLLETGNVKVVIYDVLGNKVKDLINTIQKKGHHKVIWNGTNNQHEVVSSGMYYYQIDTEEFRDIKRMILVR